MTDYDHNPEPFRYGPADQLALEEQDRRRRAAEYARSIPERLPSAAHPSVEALLAIEKTLHAEPGEAVEIPTAEMDTVLAILAERRAIHGDFTDDATLAQGFKDLMQGSRNWRAMTPVMREALEHIQTKIARICSGDFNHPDHWKDLQGYPRLVEERL